MSQSLNVVVNDDDKKDLELIDVVKDDTDIFEKYDNYDFLKKALDLLNKLEEKDNQLMQVLREKEDIHSRYISLKTANSFTGDSTQLKETRIKFNKLVRKIDKCIE